MVNRHEEQLDLLDRLTGAVMSRISLIGRPSLDERWLIDHREEPYEGSELKSLTILDLNKSRAALSKASIYLDSLSPIAAEYVSLMTLLCVLKDIRGHLGQQSPIYEEYVTSLLCWMSRPGRFTNTLANMDQESRRLFLDSALLIYDLAERGQIFFMPADEDSLIDAMDIVRNIAVEKDNNAKKQGQPPID